MIVDVCASARILQHEGVSAQRPCRPGASEVRHDADLRQPPARNRRAFSADPRQARARQPPVEHDDAFVAGGIGSGIDDGSNRNAHGGSAADSAVTEAESAACPPVWPSGTISRG